MKLKFCLVVIVCIVLSLFFIIDNALAQVAIREDNVLLVNEEPFFPIGIWNTAPRPEIRDNGFNVVTGADQIDYDEEGNVIGGTPWSDRWYEMGTEYNLMILPNMFINDHVVRCQSPTETECDPNYARDFTSYFKTKEKLLAHYPLDEPGVNWRNHPNVPELYQAIRKEDPSHPIFVVDQHWCPLKRTAEGSVGYDLDKCKKVNPNYDQWWLEEADKITHQVFGLADIVAVDHYCIWEKESGQRSGGVKEVSLAMDWAREKVDDQKPIWFVAQAFSYEAFDGYVDHWPTFEEERAMVYLALNHGAKGIFYYDWSLMHDPDTDTFKSAEAEKLWNAIGRINKELNSLIPVIIAPKIEQAVASPDSEIDLYLRRYENHWYLFAVNAEDRAVDAVFNLPADWLATSAEVYNENRIISIADSQLEDTFAPYAVHIYVMSNPAPTPTPSLTSIPTSTPTPNPNCICKSDNTCDSSCVFKEEQGILYNTPKKCSLSPSLFPTPVNQNNKNNWCKRAYRTLGDADGNDVVDKLDYYYYVAAVNGGKIPLTVNPDFNGDGEVGITDREIIIKTLTTPP